MEFSRYLNGLPFEQLAVLYESPWTCLAVLRSLPSLSQQLVLRLLFIDEPIPHSLLCGFVKQQHAEKCSKRLAVLEQLQVVQKHDDCWKLQPTFR
jgi:transcription initiation factor TFIIH subunit 4